MRYVRPFIVVLIALLLAASMGSQALLPLDRVAEVDLAGVALPLGVAAEVVRDDWGVPHIRAEDAYSLFFANGYVQAEDRLFALELLRHVGKGELAMLTGMAGLAMDLETRRELYTHEERVAALAALPQEWQDAFDAFADGVNAYIDEALLDPTKLPVEYPALAVLPEPWQATDTVAIAQYLLDVFGRGSGGESVQNAKLLAHLVEELGPAAGVDAFDDLVWGVYDGTYTTIKPGDGAPPWETLSAQLPKDLADPDAIPAAQWEAIAAAVEAENVDDTKMLLHDILHELGWPFQFGSNAQLLDARFSASGKPLLFGGPQMGYFTPSIPYELGLHGAGFDAVGMGITGAPGVIIGRSATASWTITSGASDQVDMVAEKLTGPYTYLVDGVEHEMDCRTETHIVRPGPPDFIPAADPDWRPPLPDIVTQEVCRTMHGPVLARTPDGEYAFASERSYRGDEVRSGTLWLQVGTVKSVDEFQDLFETFRFTFNFNYADEDGNILYMHVGAQPLRDERLDNRMVRPGWDSSYGWKGFLTGRDLPHVLNPESGYTVNWNNSPAPGWHSGDARELWGAMHRAELMEEALLARIAAKGTLDMDDLRAVHEYASTHHPYVKKVFDAWRDAAVVLEGQGWPGVVAELDAWAASGFDYADRTGDGNHDHKAFRLYELWMEEMLQEVFGDALGDHLRLPHWDPATGGDPHAADHGDHRNKFNVLIDVLEGRTKHPWCALDDEGDAPSCAERAIVALSNALDGDWQDPLPLRQSRFIALGAAPTFDIPISNRPSFQHFYDWGMPEGPERSRNVLPPGQASHMNVIDYLFLQGAENDIPLGAYPPHLADQLELYVRFGDKHLIFDLP